MSLFSVSFGQAIGFLVRADSSFNDFLLPAAHEPVFGETDSQSPIAPQVLAKLKEAKRVRRELDALHSHFDEAQAAREEAESEAQSLRQQLEDATEHLSQMKASLEAAEARAAFAADNHAAAVAEYKALQRAHMAEEEENAALKQELSAARRMCADSVIEQAWMQVRARGVGCANTSMQSVVL